ncbi:MAG: DUF4169 family protein [Rhizobiaceae bacterium]
MAEIVNLRQARKRAERALREETAARNRSIHGRTRAGREADRLRTERDAAFLDGHRRDVVEKEP